MSIVHQKRTEDRSVFIKTVFERLQIRKEAGGKNILVKPNIVSEEPYPTTTHPETLETCLQLLRDTGKKVIIKMRGQDDYLLSLFKRYSAGFINLLPTRGQNRVREAAKRDKDLHFKRMKWIPSARVLHSYPNQRLCV